MIKLTIKTHKKREIVDITDVIEEKIREEGIKDGVCNLFLLHTTACLTTADLDPGTDLDTLDFLEAVSPKLEYRHPHNPSHAPDHILASIIGPSLAVPIQDGKLMLGTWQKVILIEFDGPRDRKLVISQIGV